MVMWLMYPYPGKHRNITQPSLVGLGSTKDTALMYKLLVALLFAANVPSPK